MQHPPSHEGPGLPGSAQDGPQHLAEPDGRKGSETQHCLPRMGCQRDTAPWKQLPEAGAEWWLEWSPKHEEAPTSPLGYQWLGREQGQEGASVGELQAAVWLPRPQGGGTPQVWAGRALFPEDSTGTSLEKPRQAAWPMPRQGQAGHALALGRGTALSVVFPQHRDPVQS